MRSRVVGDRDAFGLNSAAIFSVCAAYVLTAVLSISFANPAAALQTVADSPCRQICTDNDLNFSNDTVCLDADYENGGGRQFRECTTCLLNSTAVDTAANVSDVEWGLFNLRYTLSECMFAYPEEIVSISSPCQVTCAPLKNATTFEIGSDQTTAVANTVPDFDFCQQGYFRDNIVNNCSFCYSFVPQQLFLANFVQALHIACRQPPVIGDTFYPNGEAIFNESAIAGPAPPGTGNTGGGGLKSWQLGLVIALPIVGGTALFALTCFCCFKFTKKRRVKMAESGRMSTFHERHPTSASTKGTPPSQYQWPLAHDEPAREMETIHVQPKHGKMPSPGLAQGRWSQHEPVDESGVPLSAGPRDDIGPAPNQSKDPFLHEQYFGVASSGVSDEDLPQTMYHAGARPHSGQDQHVAQYEYPAPSLR